MASQMLASQRSQLRAQRRWVVGVVAFESRALGLWQG
eukprot:CAMPEP_0180681584 /NCGR_PEP_ID=MMETSP1037_2-20121125/70073_1 /TAXON_ID=632150 /ORGANISM="Azadinium spinosum, Strain 3D9" /LENGTH=36 /DNA_ID= /DNA_START= /DNA_END= /DNA_ORIENTATION=